MVLAGINADRLQRAADEISTQGVTTLAVPTDVSKESDVEQLATRAYDEFGEVHVLVNNAGVSGGQSAWRSTVSDWQWVLGVNLWGVIFGLRAFVPRMLEQSGEAHIVNTASMAGLISKNLSPIPAGTSSVSRSCVWTT